MIVIGLTGSIGMGKSNAAAAFRRLGLPVYDADQAVHRLLAKGGAAVPAVEAAFPGVVRDGAVDRQALGARVFADPAALTRLEAILHPLARRAARRFLLNQRRQRRDLVVLDIPLLFETGGEALCDLVAVVSAPRAVQEARVLARPGMTREKMAGVEARQMSDAEKRRRADVVIDTGLNKHHTLKSLQALVRGLRARIRQPREAEAGTNCAGRDRHA